MLLLKSLNKWAQAKKEGIRMSQPTGSELPRIRSGTPILQITCSDCGELQQRTTTKIAPYEEQPKSRFPVKIIPDTVEVFKCRCGLRLVNP